MRILDGSLVAMMLACILVAPAHGQTGGGYKLVGTGSIGSSKQGFSVAVSADGKTIIVGGVTDDDVGAVWVYTRPNGPWTQQAKLVGADAIGSSQQGYSVALSSDGKTAIVGGPVDNCGIGAAWIYTLSNGAWTQQGNKLAGTYSGSAQQGFSVAISADGNTAIMGGPFDTTTINNQSIATGAAWVFSRSNGVWTQQAKLVGTGAVDGANGAQQGWSVAISGDGNTALMGGVADDNYGGAVWVFTRSNNAWTQQGSKLVGAGVNGIAFQGNSVALSSDGNTVLEGGYADNNDVGAAWVFARSNGVWIQQGNKLTGNDSNGSAFQGISVALSPNGDTAIVGGQYDNPQTGASWVFTRLNGSWMQLGNKLVGDNAVGRAYQGTSVAVSAEGTVVVGGPSDNSGTGAAWVFSGQIFSDIVPSAYYVDAVKLMSESGITAGCGGGRYCPTQNVTRAQMAIFIVRAIEGGDNFTASSTPYFNDVPNGSFGFQWIQKMHELGITAGCGGGNYCPNQTVTREQMAIFIIRARLGVNLAGGNPTFVYPSTPYFSDVPSDNFAFPWIQRMKLDSITAGCGANTYCPLSPVTRGDMAVFVMRGGFNQLLPEGMPILTAISPATLTQNTKTTFTITGLNTNFVQGTTQLSPIPGVTIGTIIVTSPTTLQVDLMAAGNIVPQPYSILAITDAEQAVLPNGLRVQ